MPLALCHYAGESEVLIAAALHDGLPITRPCVTMLATDRSYTVAQAEITEVET